MTSVPNITETSTPSLTSTTAYTIHPSFSGVFSGATIRLLSVDNILFPVSPETLARTSGWFQTMLGLPQAFRADDVDSEVVPMAEPSEVLAGLLSMIGGTGLPPLHDLAFAEQLLLAAEKYEMPMPIATIRALLSPVDFSPIQLYGVACRMNWEAEATKAATRTLALDIMAPENMMELVRLDKPHLMKLLSLHDLRRKAIGEALENASVFTANSRSTRCRNILSNQWCDAPIDRTNWWVLKLAWSKEPWRFLSLGEIGNVGGVPTTPIPELDALLADQCGRCKKSLYSKIATLDNLRAAAQRPPQTIEWS
ncbi:hypothetical protein BD311DRAFT_745702 [Dichomitus squalens]|uniref:BTB domain-containing protein n=1 Tax=Dichomitus squalens TaxID=114155 RepID=A0A4Q9N7J2_9APHY|nr:hypothetical protein BD311DRAFT_745702 [Dichomitus squalens]